MALVKVGWLCLRTITKPLSKKLGAKCETSPRFAAACTWLAVRQNEAAHHRKMALADIHQRHLTPAERRKVAFPTPLAPDEAVKRGVALVIELTILSVGIFCIAVDGVWARQSKQKQKAKEQALLGRVDELETRQRALQLQLSGAPHSSACSRRFSLGCVADTDGAVWLPVTAGRAPNVASVGLQTDDDPPPSAGGAAGAGGGAAGGGQGRGLRALLGKGGS